MITVVKATALAFQYNNGVNLSEQEFVKFKHDLGSPNELKNNSIKSVPNFFDYMNFMLGFF